MGHLTAVVLAGGRGTRLRPLTDKLAKPMLPVLNRPFLEYTLLALAHAGVERTFLALGYQPDPIIEHFGIGENVGMHLEYYIEDEPLGTSGAVRSLLPELDETFLVLNGDVTTQMDYKTMIDRHVENREYGTIAVHQVEDPSAYGLVVTDGEGFVTQFIEKPKGPNFKSDLINSGVYVLDPEILRFVPEGFSMFETDLFPKVLVSGVQLNTHKWSGYFNDMGTTENYLTLHKDLLNGQAPYVASASPLKGLNTQVDPSAKLEGSIILGDEARIEANVKLVGPLSLGAGCIVRQNSVLESSVLWDNVDVGAGSTVKNSVIGADVSLGANSSISDEILVDNP